MTGRLDGKVVLITGAAAGIGRAIALACAREGALLALADVAAAVEDAASEVRRLGGVAEHAVCDVTVQADVDALVERALARLGRIDCAVNNAGIEGVLRPTADYPEDVFERVIRVNLLGVWRCLRAEIPRMIAGGGGAIVNTASVGGLVGAGSFSAYVASKHAVVGLTRSAAIEYASQGIRVNAICPGVIDTAMVDRLAAEADGVREGLVAMAPMQRLGRPEEVAEAAVWLCSDAASFVTGHALAVDGGFVAQ